MHEGLIILTAIALDTLLGDPRKLPHITSLCAWFAQRAETLLYGRNHRRLRGLLFLLVVMGSCLSLYFLAQALLGMVHPSLGIALEIAVIYQSLAARDLHHHIMNVLRPLKEGKLTEARQALSWVVGRDTEKLNEQEVSRACIETTAESLCDGIVAPLFWAVILGAPGALLYRCVNTLDSLVGHRDARYAEFGTASARLDDLMNCLPARLCFLSYLLPNHTKLMVPTARDARKHPSPNAGWSESALAHRIGISLGGLNTYDGQAIPLPIMNAKGRPCTRMDITDAVRLSRHAYIKSACFLLIISSLFTLFF